MPDPEADVPPLTGPVRGRVVALVAPVLPSVAPLPASLRSVAGFAPARRAKLGGTALAAALEADPALVARAWTQVLVAVPVLAEALDAEPGHGDALEQAAALWLARPDGWEERYAAARDVVEAADRELGERRDAQESARLRERLAEAEASSREQRAALRERVDELKQEVAGLRRRLGDARQAERAARTEADEARVAADDERDAARTAAAAAEAEARRLRSQLEELRGQLSAGRSGERSERQEAGLRSRVLLDVLLDAAAGLRRELALPPVEGTPGQRVEAELEAEALAAGAGAAGPRPGSRGPVSPVVLEQLLAAPRARLLVDGYNVTKTAFAGSTLEAQRARLLTALAPLAARSGAETTVVFDAGATGPGPRPVVPAPRGVKVVFSPPGTIADDVLRRLVAAEPPGRPVVVVTSDQELQADLVRAGVRVVPAESLVPLLVR